MTVKIKFLYITLALTFAKQVTRWKKLTKFERPLLKPIAGFEAICPRRDTLGALLRAVDRIYLHELKDKVSGVDVVQEKVPIKTGTLNHQERRLKKLQRLHMGDRYDNLKQMFSNLQILH